MKKEPAKIIKEKLEQYDKLLEDYPGLKRKGATMPYTSLNGNMFSFLSEPGFGLRLPEKERNEFLKKFKTKLYERHGTVLKEYVVVKDSLFNNTKELKKYFNISFGYVKTLKPKPSKKKS